MAYSTIPKHKFGDCSCGCGGVDVAGRKVGKKFYCLDSYSTMKAKEQVSKANERNKVRGLGSYQREQGLVSETVLKEKWFRMIRSKLVGTCQCGCGNPSSKKDDRYFRHSCAHIFPKSRFESIKYHPLNYVERAFWGGCHSIMDDTSMERWVNMADWEDIKAKFYELAPLLTEEERAYKFYSQLEKMVYGN